MDPFLSLGTIEKMLIFVGCCCGMKFLPKLLQVMDEKKISRSDLARLLGTSVSNISQILNGNRNLTLDTISDISMALESDIQINFKDTYEQKSCNEIVFQEEYTSEGYAEGLPHGAFCIVI